MIVPLLCILLLQTFRMSGAAFSVNARPSAPRLALCYNGYDIFQRVAQTFQLGRIAALLSFSSLQGELSVKAAADPLFAVIGFFSF